ncbi:MAG: lycopene cyclase domain-containing protein [Candidatus Omnitrophica bacterium]|nr:lycopene cyclase domain-containing protein [Candidatus Omnitrophota bacterium]
MKEYTLLGIISVIATVIIDRVTGVRILERKQFYFFLVMILFFKLLVNGFLTGTNIVIYDARFFLGFRVTSIPIEDFLFGFSMVTLTLIFWERLKREGS